MLDDEKLDPAIRVAIRFIKDFAVPRGIKVVVTGDHSTPCNLKSHSADPVPVLFYNGKLPELMKFSEKNAKNGKLGKFFGKDLFKKVGFLR